MHVYLDLLHEYLAYLQGHDHWLLLGAALVGLLIWLGSGSLAASIAETRGRNPIVHFIAGLIIPVIYPLAISAAMSGKAAREEEKPKEQPKPMFERAEGAPPVEMAAGSEVAMAKLDENMLKAEDRSQYDQPYFRRIATDETGRMRGPFMITTSGVEVRVERIIDCLPEVLVVETATSDAKTSRLRMPYNKIEGCKEI